MAKIRITPATLEGQASKLGELNSQHNALYGQIKALMGEVAAEWEGEANAAFMASFHGHDPTFQKFEADIESFRARMMKAAHEMREAENAVKAKMSTT